MSLANPVRLLHKPSSTHPSLSDGPDGFDRSWFMGKWGVVWSTLPLWKDKKDVTITYTPVARRCETRIVEFEDLVEYKTRSSTDGSKTNTIKGIDTLSPGSNGATFDWKGKGLLFFVHSHWEVLGYGKDVEQGLEWAVTYFSKTLFTPAGIDIYVRTIPFSSKSQNLTAREVLLQRLVNEIQNIDADSIRNLAAQGFRVPGSV
ncbi:hypothetical protein J010_00257 [Cryptococcus neoformans]|nr:hypothetical protein C355_00273 [Cryptococcus neoformans var. grubii Th84]OXH19711.1 hypothetical protein J010_00257 [Cryptococcus neoformans var. grubii]OXH39196.1 hypothetical protein J009_00278 [Cryptococcus neoformans var. grubii]OXH59922.1 hypothetical protein J003_00279 [Cryptococcus neoformans var. grubii]OXH60526.1 hypothetical protein J004_00305 [Cryptococcus neoformans var. grubii]